MGQIQRQIDVGIADRASFDPASTTVPAQVHMSSQPKLLQYRLNLLGYNAGEMDGYPGPQTRTALMEAQADFCLSPTGQPNSATVDALARASGYSAPCAGARLPEGLAANSPLFSGVYVDEPSKCELASLPYETVFDSQILIRGSSIMHGYEDSCTTERTDIRDGVTLFRGACQVGNQIDRGSWRLDVLTNNSFVELDRRNPVSRLPEKTFTRCSDDSLLHRTLSDVRASENTTEVASSSISVLTPERGTALRSNILDAIRPEAEKLYGAPVEFVVGDMRVAGSIAIVSVNSQRPGGQPIDLESTPGFRSGAIDFMSGDPTELQAFLREVSGSWTVERYVVRPSEAWWIEYCDTWAAIFFRQTCDDTNAGSARNSSTSSDQEINKLSKEGDFARITGVGRSDLALVLSGPTITDGLAGTVKNGDRVRKIECRNFGQENLCQIEFNTEAGTRAKGWIARTFLTSP